MGTHFTKDERNYDFMLIDTHCHLSFKAFDDTWPDAIKRARENGIQMIVVGAAKQTSEKAIAIATESGDGVFAAVGLHPTHTDEEFDYDWFSQAADNPKVVAIGETGIDHFHLPPHPTLSPGGRGEEGAREVILQKQEDLLRQHLTIAREKKLPVILHSRDGKTESPPPSFAKATAGRPTPSSLHSGGQAKRRGLASSEHLLRIVKEFGYFNCVLHCFGGDWEVAKKVLDLGLMISFTGIVTFKNASEALKEVVRNAPLDRFMIETDSPYLAPEPQRGKQNEPVFVEYVARGIAEIRRVSCDEIARATTENAVKFFKLGK